MFFLVSTVASQNIFAIKPNSLLGDLICILPNDQAKPPGAEMNLNQTTNAAATGRLERLVMQRYRLLKGCEYRSQSKRGGRPMVIQIPAGSTGVKQRDTICFPELGRRGHNPFVFWVDVYNDVEPLGDA